MDWSCRTAKFNQDRVAMRSPLTAIFPVLLFAVVFSAKAAQPATDQKTVERARSLYQSGQFVEAEKLLGEAITAIDAGKLPKNNLGRCLAPLADIYRSWGRYEDALQAALRYRQFVNAQPSLDRKLRDQSLRENAIVLAEVLMALGRHEEAEQYVVAALALPLDPANSSLTISLQSKLAKIAASQNKPELAADRWEQVTKFAADAVAKMEQGPSPGAGYAAAARVLAESYVARENYSDALQVLERLLVFYAKRGDGAGAVGHVSLERLSERRESTVRLDSHDSEHAHLHDRAR
jgi:tetratricopeptide (TPR) repeat protein